LAVSTLWEQRWAECSKGPGLAAAGGQAAR